MTFIITATVSASIIYFLAAFVHHSMASICRRHHEAMIAQTVSKTVEAVATVEPEEETIPVIELPKKITIRSLRDFVRSHELQDAIREATGRSVSKLKKDELHHAVMLALA